MSKLIELTNKKFGRWTVIEKGISKSSNNTLWICKCDCGKIKNVGTKALRSGKSKSCGCLRSEMLTNKRNKNIYKFNENTIIGITSNGDEFIFDFEYYDIVKKHYWYTDNNGYISTKSGTKKLLQLHKLITNTNGDKIIDHINRDKKDNRKENLRVCTARENCINRGMLKNNTSGTMGVCFDKSRNKWTATIVINNKNKHLGRYENIEDAIIARLKAELKYFRKEFAPQRHLFKEYGIK